MSKDSKTHEEQDSASQGDHVVRALTDDDSFRVMTARTTGLVAENVRCQSARGKVAQSFGNLLTGTVLVRETMAPDLRVQGVLRAAGGQGTLVADTWPDGGTRGLANVPEGTTELALGDDAILQFMRTLPNGSMHTGVVQVPAEASVRQALMAYMQDSEQIFTVMSMATVLDDQGAVQAAGGYVVQLLPGAVRSMLEIMTARLDDFQDISEMVARADYSADLMLEEVLYGIDFKRIETRPARFHCGCSETAVLGSLATLDRSEIEDMVNEGQAIEINCDYCGQGYQIAAGKLKTLLHSQ